MTNNVEGRLWNPLELWFRAVDPIRLDWFRRAMASTFLIYMVHRFLHAYEWLTDYGYHVTKETKSYWSVDPFPLLQTWMVPFFGILLFGSIAGMMLGRAVRLSSWIALGCAIYIQGADSASAFSLNKLYIVFFAVLACAPSPREVLVAGVPTLRQSAWPIRILQLTVMIQYFTAGACKVYHGDWLTRPDGLWTHSQGLYGTEVSAWLLRTFSLDSGVWAMMMYSALAFELLAPITFGVRRLRIIAIPWGLSFHLMIALTMKDLIFFSAQLVALYVVFLDEALLLRARARLAQWREKLLQLGKGFMQGNDRVPKQSDDTPGAG